MAGPRRKSLAEKLARYRVVTDGCWRWTGYKNPGGYGHVREGGKTWLAHRAAYVVANGPIPDGMVVRHACDNPECTNPEHLLLGTHADNVADKVARQRQYRGDSHHATKITVRQMREVVPALRSSGMSWRAIARHFGVGHDAVRSRAEGMAP